MKLLNRQTRAVVTAYANEIYDRNIEEDLELAVAKVVNYTITTKEGVILSEGNTLPTALDNLAINWETL